MFSGALYLDVIISHFFDDFPAYFIEIVLQISRLGDRLTLSIDLQHLLQDIKANNRNLEVGLFDAELDNTDQALDQPSIFVFLLALCQDIVEALKVVLPVLREELLDCVLGVIFLHECSLLYELSLDLLSRRQLFGLFLTLLIWLRLDPVASQGWNNALIVVLFDFSNLCPGLDGSRVAHFVGDFGVRQTAEVVHLRFHELVAVLVLRRFGELIFLLFCGTGRALILGLIF